MHELLHQLVRRFNLEAAQARQLWQMSQLHARPPALRGWLEGALAAVAALLLGAGLVFWVAANWPEQTRAFKFNALQAAVLLPALAALALPRLRTACLLLATLALGALLAFVGQTYQTGADPWQLFAAWAALALGRAIHAARSRRNYGLPLLLAGLGAADALYLWSIWQGDYGALMQRFNAGLLCMAVIALLIARRVIPFFAMRAVSGLQIPMHAASGPWQLGAGVVALACLLAGWWPGLAAGLAVAGLIALWQVLAWKPQAVRRVPLLWILYLGHAALGAGLLVAGAHAAGWVLRPAWPVHVIGAGGFALLIIGMCTRTSMGHLGLPLRTDRSMVAAYALVIAAAVLRLAALLPTALSLAALHASAAAWVLAFALYLWRFALLLVRPRADRQA